MSAIIKPNAERIASEVIDGDVIIIDLELGNYFNLIGAAADIWLMIEQQPTVENLISALAQRYNVEQQVVAAPTREFVAGLDSESLIRFADTAPEADAALNLANDPVAPFTPPVLHKYTNMSDLLLLDPIHDVDSKGWPSVPATE